MPKDEPTSHKKSHKKEKKKLKPVYIDTDQPIDALKTGSPHPPISRPEEKAIAGSDALANEIAVPNSMMPSGGGRNNSRLELGPQFEPVQVEPALECLDFDADTHELWLLQLPLDWRPDTKAAINLKKLPGGARTGSFTDLRGNHFVLREEDPSLAAPVYVANASHQGSHLRCNRRITIARDHTGQEPPATPVSSSKKRKKDANAEAPKQAGRVELHLDDILAAEASPTGKLRLAAAESTGEKKRKTRKKDREQAV